MSTQDTLKIWCIKLKMKDFVLEFKMASVVLIQITLICFVDIASSTSMIEQSTMSFHSLKTGILEGFEIM